MNFKNGTSAEFCDDQPIVQNESIQAFGCVLILDFSFKIIQVSRNVETLLGVRCAEILGKNLADFVTLEDYRLLNEELKGGDLRRLNGLNLRFKTKLASTSFPASFSVYANYWIMELELMDAPMDSAKILKTKNQILKLSLDFKQCGTPQELFDKTTVKLKTILGMDKVMIYGFDEDWHGTVLAESQEPEMDSYLGLKFPASDIPEPARRFYVLNPIRMIPDSGYSAIRIEPPLNPLNGQPPDLRTCILRGVVPVHLEYLKNMKVTTSISVSITKNGVLWGLIALHHRFPKTIHVKVRSVLELLAECFSARLSFFESAEAQEHIIGVVDFGKAVIESVLLGKAPIATINLQIERISQLLRAHGAAIFWDGQWFEWGSVPSHAQLLPLVEWLKTKEEQPVYCTDFLSGEYAAGEVMGKIASGLLAISLAGKFEDMILWFRPEETQTVKWGGDPGQTVHFGTDGMTYHPRKSFAIWQETVNLHSVSWKASEKLAATEIRRMLRDALFKSRSAKLKMMSGILPICAVCKKIRDEKKVWHILEQYVESRSTAEFSHSLCPECHEKARQEAGLKM